MNETIPENVKNEPQTLTESASNPNEDYGDDKDSPVEPKDNKEEEEFIPGQENKKSKSVSNSTNFLYVCLIFFFLFI